MTSLPSRKETIFPLPASTRRHFLQVIGSLGSMSPLLVPLFSVTRAQKYKKEADLSTIHASLLSSRSSVHIFGEEDGSIYVVTSSGALLWYKDLARNGTEKWANNGSRLTIGSGWNFSSVFSGGGGVIYAINSNGDLFWYKDLAQDGTEKWANNNGLKIGSGWNFSSVFSGGGGVIYAINSNGDLFWYKDLAQDGTEKWANNNGLKIGSGWNSF
jgi:Tachylectin